MFLRPFEALLKFGGLSQLGGFRNVSLLVFLSSWVGAEAYPVEAIVAGALADWMRAAQRGTDSVAHCIVLQELSMRIISQEPKKHMNMNY
eukprot:3571996-Amphidinium_carterae.1